MSFIWMSALPCGHHLPVSWFSIQLGVKITSNIMYAPIQSKIASVHPGFNDKLHFTILPSKIHLRIHIRIPTLFPGGWHLCIWFSSRGRNCKTSLHINILKQRQFYSVLHHIWLLEETCLIVLMTAIQGVLTHFVD